MVFGIADMNGYGYKKKKEEKRKKELREKEKGQEWKEGEKWYGLTIMGRYTERFKAIIRREGVRTFRNGGRKLEHKVK